MAKSYKVSVFAGTKVVADMAQQVKNATIDASLELKPIAGGATEATAVLLAPPDPLPINSNRKRTKAIGWYKNATGPAWEAPKDADNVNWWSFETGLWSLGSSVDMPKIDTSTLTSKTDFNTLQANLYGDNSIPVYLEARKNVNVIPDSIGTATAGYLLGMGGSTTGTYYAPKAIPAKTYTCYVVINISNKGQLDNLSFWRQTTFLGSVPIADIPLNQDFAFVFPLIVNSIASGSLLAQVRTRYPLASTSAASLVIKQWNIYEGAYTLQQIEDSFLPVDKSKVAKAKKSDSSDFATQAASANTSDRATIADKATTVDTLPEKYVNKVVSEADKISKKFVPNKILNYTDTSGSTSIINYVDEAGLLHLGTTVPTTGRLWFGIDFHPNGYASQAKNYVVVLKGKVKGSGIRNLVYKKVGESSEILAQDMVENEFSDFEKAIDISYSAGVSGNGRYTFIQNENYSGVTQASFEAIFEIFTVFERIEGFSLNDYIKASKGEYESFNPEMLPDTLASKEYVAEQVGGIEVSKYSPSDYRPKTDVQMFLGYGQSLAVGGGASSSTSGFSNSITFSTGMTIGSTAANASFIPVANSGTFTPISATLVAFLQLLAKENKVDLSKFGNKYLIASGGVSGGSITSMNKGTDAYTNCMNAVQRAKNLCDAEGKTFSVPVITWQQGEGDRSQSQEWYYTRLKQLFEDFNSDIKAITGQIDDVKIITYQTSPWRQVWYPSGSTTQQSGDTNFDYPLGVQKAQLQVANEMTNVYMCGYMGQFQYSDFFHPSDRANIGNQVGVCIKRILVDGLDFPAFQPISHKIIGNFIHLTFTPPVLPIRFDISGDAWHNPNGKQANFGFKVKKDGVDIISNEPYLTRGNTVIIPCSVNPVGATVQYAINGHFGGGNLCDSQNVTVRNKNIDYKIDNFCIGFDDYFIN